MSAASARHFETRDSERGLRAQGAEPARRPASARTPGSARTQTRARASAERRRRQRHFARRRRDLLEDTALALLVTVVLLTVTAGLGVIALLEIPMAVTLLATILIPRVRRHRQGVRTPPRTRSRSR
jgi:predicted anti-sigma-YlaC factor YlaD